jgi:tagatose 6-phosphate kinase
VILAAGLTPAWQQVLVFPRFLPGEVNRAREAHWCASGKVLNVGCALSFLGVPSKTLCVVGGVTGQQICDDFESLRIPVRWVMSTSPSRICTTILDQSTGSTTELVENSPPISQEELTTFFEAFLEESRSANLIVLSGSLPEGTPSNYYRRLLEQTHSKAILDIRGRELEEVLALRPFVVKPNREELGRTVGRELHSESEMFEAMAVLRERGAEWVVISQGPAPLLALGPAGRIRVEIPRVNVCNPIGCGDCLAAGIAAGLERGESIRDSIQIGVHAAAENAKQLLPARNLTRLP